MTREFETSIKEIIALLDKYLGMDGSYDISSSIYNLDLYDDLCIVREYCKKFSIFFTISVLPLAGCVDIKNKMLMLKKELYFQVYRKKEECVNKIVRLTIYFR